MTLEEMVVEYRRPVGLAASIIRDVAEWHDVDVHEMVSSRRHSRYVFARWHAAFLLRNCKRKYTTSQIGRFLGNRDHTTIVHAVQQYRKNNVYTL